MQREYQRCQQYPGYFIVTYCQIHHPIRGMIPFTLWPWQYALLSEFLTAPRMVILKARQLGCSELVCAYVGWLIRFHQGKLVLLLSQKQDDASDLLDRVRFMFEHLPEWFADEDGCRVVKSSATVLELEHQTPQGTVTSRVQSLPATRGTGRGKPASLVVLDEWAHQPWQEEIWAAIAPTVATGGQVIGMSSANGVGNVFHRTVTKARRGENDFRFHFIPWSAHPDRDAAWHAEQSRKMEPWQLHQEFPSQPDEAFVQSGRPVFDQAYLAAHAMRIREATEARPPQSAEGLTIFATAQKGHEYLIGADVAEGLSGGDFSTACVVDATTGTQVAALHGHWPVDVFARKLFELGAIYAFPMLAVERNNHGHAVLVKLLDLPYPKLYYHEDALRAGTPEESRPGWVTDRFSKPLMIQSLASGLREQTYKPMDLLFLDEAMYFHYRLDGGMSAAPGFHDDRVIAHAIAAHLATVPDSSSANVQLFRDLHHLSGMIAAGGRING